MTDQNIINFLSAGYPGTVSQEFWPRVRQALNDTPIKKHGKFLRLGNHLTRHVCCVCQLVVNACAITTLMEHRITPVCSKCGNECRTIIGSSDLYASLSSRFTKRGKSRKNPKTALRNVGQERLDRDGYDGLTYPAYFRKCQRGAAVRHLEFTITISYMNELWFRQNGICPLTGESLIISPYDENGNNSLSNITASIDRIDNSVGYIPGNVRWVHKTANLIRRAMTDIELIWWCKKIAQYAESKLTAT